MKLKSLDILDQEKNEIMQKMCDAVKDDDAEAFAAASRAFYENIADQVAAKFQAAQETTDVNVLASRGVRQLTSEESSYFQKLGEAMKSSVPKQALADLDAVMPKTTIDAIFEDLTTSHPLLEVIDVRNTYGVIEWLMNANEDQLGTWGKLSAEITKELASGFKKVNMSLSKYSAFLPVAKAYLDLGPVWLESYVRTVLQETIYLGLEEAIVKGTGKDMPIGMIRQVGDSVTVTAGVYPVKEKVEVTSLDPLTYGLLLAELAVSPNGHQRAVQNVIMLVSPADYFSKVFPATTVRGADGRYVTDVLPYPTRVIQSVFVEENSMVIGLGKKYFLGVGIDKSGRIDYDDSVNFLEDERIYVCKTYAHGEPKDNNAFIYCDITDLKPTVQQVIVSGSVETTGGGTEQEETP